MAVFVEDPDNYPAGITVLETTDLVLGGLGEPANMQADELADRTAYLKKRSDNWLVPQLFSVNGYTGTGTLPSSKSTLFICIDDTGPYSELSSIPMPTGMESGDVIGVITSQEISYGIELNGGTKPFVRLNKPCGTRLKVYFGSVILKYMTGGIYGAGMWLVLSEISHDNTLPAGMFATFPTGSSVKPGWLDCDGSTVLKADYPLLWAEIGTTYGSATATEFTLPDSGSSIDSPGANMLWRIKF